jgi:hypothetical protein
MRKIILALATAGALAGTAPSVLAHDYDDDVYGHRYYRGDYYRDYYRPYHRRYYDSDDYYGWHRWRHHWWWRHHHHYDYDYDRPYHRRSY